MKRPKIWIHLTDAAGHPCSFRTDAIKGIYSRFDGSGVVVLDRTIIKVHHPVAWKDKEILAACKSAQQSAHAMSCAVDPQGRRLVDVEVVQANDVHVVVKETVNEIRQLMKVPSSAMLSKKRTSCTTS